MLAVIFSCFAIICTVLLWLWKRRESSPLGKIYSPPGILFTGVTWEQFTCEVSERYRRWREQAGKEGLVRVTGLTGRESVCIFRQDHFKEVLVTKCTKFLRSDLLKHVVPFIGNGIFSAYGAHHAWQHKLMAPLLSFTSTKRYTKQFDDHAKNVCKVWSSRCSSGTTEFPVDEDLALLTMDVFGDVAFGYKFNGVLNGGNDVTSQFSKVLRGRLDYSTMMLRAVVPFYDYLPFRANIEYNEAVKVTNSILAQIVREKRGALHQEKEDHSTSDLLTTLIEARDESSGKGMDDQLLRENMWTLLLAGYETTSVALTWMLYHLALNGDMQQKAREEVTRIVGASETILAEHVDQFEYVTCVVKESMRLTPAVPETLRDCKIGATLDHHLIPAGTDVIIPIIAVHLNEEYWKDPYVFMPERFLASDNPRLSGISGQTYLPFSTGPRSCLGAKFAMQEMKTVLARLLMTFRFSLDEQYRNIGNRVSITMRPHPPPKFKLTLVQQPP